MGIRETLGVGRTTKIKLVDRQRNRLDEKLRSLQEMQTIQMTLKCNQNNLVNLQGLD